MTTRMMMQQQVSVGHKFAKQVPLSLFQFLFLFVSWLGMNHHLLLPSRDLALRKAIVSLITEALSNWELRLVGTGNSWAMSVKISDSLLRRQRAASRDFSLRFSEFLQATFDEIGILIGAKKGLISSRLWMNRRDTKHAWENGRQESATG